MIEHRTRVLFADTDAAGIVYHANYLHWFEAARGELLRAGGCSYAEIQRRGFFWPIVEAHLRYRAPARYDDELRVCVRVAEVRAASATFEYRVLRAADGALLCDGSTRLGCLRDGHVVPIPDDIRAVVERFSGPFPGA